MEANFVINSTQRSVDRRRARRTDRLKKKREEKKQRKEESVGRERHDWRMDRSRSEGETERRGRRVEVDRGKEIKERDSQHLVASSLPLSFYSSVCTRVSF